MVDFEIVAVKTCNRNGNAQNLGTAIRLGQSFDIVRRIAFTGGFEGPFKQAVQIVKPQQ